MYTNDSVITITTHAVWHELTSAQPFASFPNLQLLRIGLEALESGLGGWHSHNAFVVSVARGVSWPH